MSNRHDDNPEIVGIPLPTGDPSSERIREQQIRDLLRATLAAIKPTSSCFHYWAEKPEPPRDPLARKPIPRSVIETRECPACFNRFGQQTQIHRGQVELAIEIVDRKSVSLHELREALKPLAKLPVDSDSADTTELYRLGDVSIMAGHIRLARQYVRPL